jgi:hypothetical protein
MEHLVHAYPHYIDIHQMPAKKAEHKLELVRTLWTHGLLMIEPEFSDN